MSGLILKLAPNERILVNGAVIENGERRTRISIKTPNAAILRLRDAIHPAEAQTPVSRICYICQLVLTAEAEEDHGREQALEGIAQLAQVFPLGATRELLDDAARHLREGNFYLAMKLLRGLLPLEASLLAGHGS
ncbi:flagellar biosynthesis repressor FlbT [Paracoccus sp. MBLB3053]|uniref:Flagellar biosynthesis repressor FlbT n=1 Tax=Paracoccus aurantius TaxID=3073814 RepID=A0ABU2HP38_9RHOB|nr:flagellar biosynthesis repressor FlbT [Paracoccus sp. MBLB3053]MDS9466069.1 flagellar biosynthesis repressor FlbT [Paracoccus sp. MBLB3053]